MGANAALVNDAYAAFGRGDIGAVLAVLRADGTRTSGDQRSYGAVHVFDFRAGKISRFREYVALDTAI